MDSMVLSLYRLTEFYVVEVNRGRYGIGNITCVPTSSTAPICRSYVLRQHHRRLSQENKGIQYGADMSNVIYSFTDPSS